MNDLALIPLLYDMFFHLFFHLFRLFRLYVHVGYIGPTDRRVPSLADLSLYLPENGVLRRSKDSYFKDKLYAL